MTVSLKQVLGFLGAEKAILGPADRDIKGVSSIASAKVGDLTFCSYLDSRGTEMVNGSKASAIICNEALKTSLREDPNKTYLLVKNPRLAFIRVFTNFFPPARPSGIHPSARIGKRCTIGNDVYVGENAVIGNRVHIGEHSEIHPNVRIYDDVRIGKNAIIHSGAVIGGDGFGFERNENGKLERFPHKGSVIIADSVEIGANTCIDRGTLDDTVIESGTKIDNLVHVAHNVRIGKNCGIVAHSMIGGGTRIGDHSWIAPCACVRDGLEIGNRVLIGMGAVVTRDVTDNTIVYGVPAKPKGKTTDDK
jgi:UDP-3-O-[3-hydroxymyristoyl] glucosamine N-acyltransferase